MVGYPAPSRSRLVRRGFLFAFKPVPVFRRLWTLADMATQSQNKTAERAAFSVPEFAAQFGKKRGWGYDLVAKGKVRTITGYGTVLIPASEIDRILNREGASK